MSRRLDLQQALSLDEAEKIFDSRGVGQLLEPTPLKWSCSEFGGGAAVCTTERLEVEALADEVEFGSASSSFTHVRLIRRVDGHLTGADWPAPTPRLFSTLLPAAEPGDDCMDQCDQGGEPIEDADVDEVPGRGTGMCYSECHRLQEERTRGLTYITTALELTGLPGVDWYVFRRTVTRVVNRPPAESEPAQDEQLADAVEPASDPTGDAAVEPSDEADAAEEDADSQSQDYLLLQHPGGSGLVAAKARAYDTLERPSPSLWIFRANGEVRDMFLSLADGGVLEGAQACANPEGSTLPGCDGGL